MAPAVSRCSIPAANAVASRNRLLTTIAYQLEGKRTYALEGAIFVAGAAVQWLRDGLKLIDESSDIGAAGAAGRSGRAGLSGAGLCRPGRAVLGCAGARRDLRPDPQFAARPRFARAALEAVGYQTRDLLEAMRADWPAAEKFDDRAARRRRHDRKRRHDAVPCRHSGEPGRPADGDGNDGAWVQLISPGRAAGICPDLDGFAAQWQLDRRFEPRMDFETRERKYSGWSDAVRRTLTRQADRAWTGYRERVARVEWARAPR